MSAYFKRISTRLGALFTGGVLMREQKLFLAAVSLFFIATGLSGIFVNTFIYSCAYESGALVSGLRSVAYYNLCMYASIAFFSVIIGIMGKSANSRILMCLGIVCYAVMYILLLVLGGESIKYIWLLGILSGMGTAFFNLNYSGAVSCVTTADSCGYYLSLQGIINSFTAVIAPLAAGTLAELIGGAGGYTVLFIVTLLILASSIICCFSLSYDDGKKGGTQFGNVFVFSLKNKGFRCCAIADAVSGIRDGVTSFLVPLLLFTLKMSNTMVGIYLLIYTGIQVLVSRRANQRVNSHNRIMYVFMACVLYMASGFLLLAGIDLMPIFSYGVVTALAQGLFVTAVFSVFYEMSYKMPHAHRKNLEILSVREFYINVGRIIGVFTLLLVPQQTSHHIYTLIVFGLLQIIVWIALASVSPALEEKIAE